MAAKKKTKPSKKTSAKKSPAPNKPAAKKPAPAKKPAVAKKKAAPKKAVAKKKAAPKKAAKAKAKTKAPARRDRAGHIDPKYGKELLAKRGRSDADDRDRGFLRRARSKDDLAEQLGEEVISDATSGENSGEDVANQEVPEERGGPFIVTRASQEFAYEPDASNPKRSRREPFPRT